MASDVDRFPRCPDCGHPLMFHTKHGCTVRSSGNVDEPPSCCECDLAGAGGASWRKIAAYAS